MTTQCPAIDELHGVWQRAFTADGLGRGDPAPAIWVQGFSYFVVLSQPAPGLQRLTASQDLDDLSRADLLDLCEQQGHAGVLRQGVEWFNWNRVVDLHPGSGVPDSATLRYRRGILVQSGAYEQDEQHWDLTERSPGTVFGARLLDTEDGSSGVVVRSGSWFGYARSRVGPRLWSWPRPGRPLYEQLLACPTRDAVRRLLDCEVSVGKVADGQWVIERSTLPHRVGVAMQPVLDLDGRLVVRDTGPFGRCRLRVWQLREVEGSLALLGTAPPEGAHGHPVPGDTAGRPRAEPEHEVPPRGRRAAA